MTKPVQKMYLIALSRRIPSIVVSRVKPVAFRLSADFTQLWNHAINRDKKSILRNFNINLIEKRLKSFRSNRSEKNLNTHLPDFTYITVFSRFSYRVG